MNETRILKFLQVVKRELSAVDARAELGGADPKDPRLIWYGMPGQWRLVAVFDDPPAARQQLADRLAELVDAFHSLTDPNRSAAPPALLASDRLDSELETLALRTEAACALVIDTTSPMIWGYSEHQRLLADVEAARRADAAFAAAENAGFSVEGVAQPDPETLRDALAEAGVAPEHAVTLARLSERARDLRGPDSRLLTHSLLAARAVARVREVLEVEHGGRISRMSQTPSFGYLARSFGSIYVLVLAFRGPFSELNAEGSALHVLPAIEKLVLSLPPVDPSPGGKLLRLRPPE